MDKYCRNLLEIYESKAWKCIGRTKEVDNQQYLKTKNGCLTYYYLRSIKKRLISYPNQSVTERRFDRISPCEINSKIKFR